MSSNEFLRGELYGLLKPLKVLGIHLFAVERKARL